MVTSKSAVIESGHPKTRRAVVTGGTRGTGAAVVRRLQEEGLHVIALAPSIGANVTDDFVPADLTDADAAERVPSQVLVTGAPDIIVHVAGGSHSPAGRWLRRARRGPLEA